MKTNRTDIWDEEIFVGDTIRVGIKQYIVKFGNYKYFGVDRIGLYIENASQSHPAEIMPLMQAKSFIKVKKSDAVFS
jgi:hypothetical protein